jgi:AcrR family transcriptional regulator
MPADPRTRLVEAAIRLLAANGPSEVKARSVSSEAGLSTMGVYTYFGGVPELLQAVADEGFEQQAAIFRQVASTDDPMTDLCAMALACRDFARRNPHLYDLMFGLSIHGRYTPSRAAASSEPRDRSAAFTASYSLLLGECERLVESNCVRKTDPDLIAAQLWSTLHGFIMLELGGYFSALADPAAEVLVRCGSHARRIVHRGCHRRLGTVSELATRGARRPQRRISPAQALKLRALPEAGAPARLPSSEDPARLSRPPGTRRSRTRSSARRRCCCPCAEFVRRG